MKATLPNVVMSIREEKYEHLDTMWADTAKDTVFPRVSGVFDCCRSQLAGTPPPPSACAVWVKTTLVGTLNDAARH